MSVHFFCDLETTGLNLNTCQIIEIAVIITTLDYEILEEYQAVINPGSVSYEKTALGFHKKSGLFDEVRDGISLTQAEQEVFNLLLKYEHKKRRVKLAGNSVHFDRKFLEKFMPSIVGHLSSRNLDVSSFEVICEAKYGKELAVYKAARPHRALPDLHRSINQLKFLSNKFLKEI